ncbi:MAG: hypothetical protein ACE5K2_04100 [Candidatus Zixiibacteriota bacterium]
MKTVYSPEIEYIPPKDEILLKFSATKLKLSVKKGRFKVWWDEKGNIGAIAIASPTKELEEFKKTLKTVRLRGIWKGIEITEDDIDNVRKEMWKNFGG